MDRSEYALWERHRALPSTETHHKLVLHYAPLVKFVAGRLASGMPTHVELADLTSYGIFGLLDAIEKFELERGLKFETYAVTRIRGAILDELRGSDWVPRSVRTKARKLAHAMAELEYELHRAPTDGELSEKLGCSIEELERTLEQLAVTSVVTLDEAVGGGGDGPTTSLADSLADMANPSPEDSYAVIETREMLRATILRLNERQQTVISLYYFEGMTLGQIGDVLGVTESRICQIHTKAIVALRHKCAELLVA